MDDLHERTSDTPPTYESKLHAGPDEYQFRMAVKFGRETLFNWEGHPRTRASITLAELKTLVEAEAAIEKATGLRIHIVQAVD